jgi:hypothetical protein
VPRLSPCETRPQNPYARCGNISPSLKSPPERGLVPEAPSIDVYPTRKESNRPLTRPPRLGKPLSSGIESLGRSSNVAALTAEFTNHQELDKMKKAPSHTSSQWIASEVVCCLSSRACQYQLRNSLFSISKRSIKFRTRFPTNLPLTELTLHRALRGRVHIGLLWDHSVSD